jgi:hypothetical protein
MGLFKKLKKKISIKNISPIAKVGSIVKKPAQKVISTGKIGVKDVVSVSPIGIGVSAVKSGVSNVKDVIVDKPILPKDEFVSEVPKKELNQETKEETKPIIEDKNKNTLLYLGIGVGALTLIGAIIYSMKKK